jgi:hypothetical protein
MNDAVDGPGRRLTENSERWVTMTTFKMERECCRGGRDEDLTTDEAVYDNTKREKQSSLPTETI